MPEQVSDTTLLLSEFRQFRDELRTELSIIKQDLAVLKVEQKNLGEKITAAEKSLGERINSVEQRLLTIERGFIFTVGTGIILSEIRFWIR